MHAKSPADRINTLNIGLMLVAAAAAFARPFEVFLVAYALLGPLHYLTEISWLHDKGYYTKGRYDHLFLISVSVLVTITSLEILPDLPVWLYALLTYVAFGSALAFVLTDKPLPRMLAVSGLIVTGAGIAAQPALQSLFGLLLPTLVHVFVFTALFVLVGALKGRSVSGIGSLVVFCLCAGSFFVLSPNHAGYHVGDYVRNSYRGFATLNHALMSPFQQHDIRMPGNLQEYLHFVNEVLFQTPASFAVMGFIAFAYTYHYLNWFSKTSIIQWHNISRKRLAAVVAIWAASVAVYAYDYRLGLKWLFFLSFSHVLLEFPLNHLTFMGIGRELRKIVSPTAVVAAGTGGGGPKERKRQSPTGRR
jgi:hypothetical protein